MIAERLSALRTALLAVVFRIDSTIAVCSSVRAHATSLMLIAHGRSISRCPTCGAYTHRCRALSRGSK